MLTGKPDPGRVRQQDRDRRRVSADPAGRPRDRHDQRRHDVRVRKCGATRPPHCWREHRCEIYPGWLDVVLIVLLGGDRPARRPAAALLARTDRRAGGWRSCSRWPPDRVQQRAHRGLRLSAVRACAGNARDPRRAVSDHGDRARAGARSVLALRARRCGRGGGGPHRRQPAARRRRARLHRAVLRPARFHELLRDAAGPAGDRGGELLPERDDRGDPRLPGER